MKKTVVTILILLISIDSLLQAQQPLEEDLPDWLLMEQGKEAFESRDFGRAFRLFRAALEKSRINPEAHMWMAVIYEEEGEYDLAERHYQEALSSEKDLYILEDAYMVRYRLAEMYERSKQFGKYEATLRDIVASDEKTIEKIALRSAMTKNIRELGIDKLVELYRIHIPEYRQAYAELGIFYYRTGRYGESLEHLTLAVLETCTRCIEALVERDPIYTFVSMEGLFIDCAGKEYLTGFLERSDIFRNLYYLGCTLYAEGEPAHARDLWTLVNTYDTKGVWQARSAEQLRSPFIEPVLTTP